MERRVRFAEKGSVTRSLTYPCLLLLLLLHIRTQTRTQTRTHTRAYLSEHLHVLVFLEVLDSDVVSATYAQFAEQFLHIYHFSSVIDNL